MNKYYGLLELKHLKIPCVEWRKYVDNMYLSPDYKWTVRVANQYGNDKFLPYRLGISSFEAHKIGRIWNKKYDLVIVNEYFESKISGNLLLTYDVIIIEWGYGNSTNITREGLFVENIEFSYREDLSYRKTILDKKFIYKLAEYSTYIWNKYKNYLLEGKSLILEWSIVDNSINQNIDFYKKKELIFYDLRLI